MMIVEQSTKQDLTWSERQPLLIAHDLQGGNLGKFMRAVMIVSDGMPPGFSYEAQFLTDSLVSPRDMHKSLVAGALRVAHDNNMFELPEFDENIAQHVGIALATAMIWEEDRPLEDIFHQDTMDAIARAERKIKSPIAVADFQLRLWNLVNKGLETFDVQARQTRHSRPWYARRLLSSLIVADAKDEFDRDDFEVTSHLVGRALNENFEGAVDAFQMAAKEIFGSKTRDGSNISAHEMRVFDHAWRKRIAGMATTIADRIHNPVQCWNFLIPMLKALNYKEEDVRAGIVEYIVTRFSRDEEEFARMVTTQLFVGSDQRIGILLLRGYEPTDRAVTRLLDQVRKIQTADIDIEIAELWAYWESQGFDVHANIQSMLNTYSRRSGWNYDEMILFMPPMMSVEGGLAVVRHGLGSDNNNRKEFAIIGLLTAVDAWMRNEMLSTDKKLGTLEGFIEEFYGQISDEQRSDIQAALYGRNEELIKWEA